VEALNETPDEDNNIDEEIDASVDKSSEDQEEEQDRLNKSVDHSQPLSSATSSQDRSRKDSGQLHKSVHHSPTQESKMSQCPDIKPGQTEPLKRERDTEKSPKSDPHSDITAQNANDREIEEHGHSSGKLIQYISNWVE